MALISNNTFDPLRRYVGVRLQQGVPIVDADWNELEDVRRFEVRAFLKWFVGDGVPAGNDGFRVIGQLVSNDFLISAGPSAVGSLTDHVEIGLRQVGRFLADGLDVIIQADTPFRSQPLHTSRPGAAALATKLGVPVIDELPSLDGTILVYLDVWERLVTPAEDTTLIFPGLATESCARTKREWVVRAHQKATVPASPDADWRAGHSYVPLATIVRRSTSGNVNPSDVTDLRATQLLLPPATLVQDMLGTTSDLYRQGLGRPPISLRDAINALLRGELPSTADAALTADGAGTITSIGRGFFVDVGGGITAVSQSNRVGNTQQVFASRLDLGNVAAGFSTPVQVTSGTLASSFPSAVSLPNGDVFVVYQTATAAGSDVFYKRAPLAQLTTPPTTAQPVMQNGTGGITSTTNSHPFAVLAGDYVVVFFYVGAPTNLWHFRRYRHTDGTFIDPPLQLSPTATAATPDFHAAIDASGNVWAAFRDNAGLFAIMLNPKSGVVSNAPTAAWAPSGLNTQPFVLCASSGDVWVYWSNSTQGPTFTRFTGSPTPAWTAPAAVTGLTSVSRSPVVIEDTTGGIWLFWVVTTPSPLTIQFMRRDPHSGAWGQQRSLTFSTGDNDLPFALSAPNHAFWIFWTSGRTGTPNLYYKQLITTI